jgi:hypothetical protein
MIDNLVLAFLEWLGGTDDEPGAAERGIAWVRGLFRLLIRWGFMVPMASILIGLLGGWLFGSVAFAQFVMGVGIIFGLIASTVIGWGFALVVDVIVRVLRNNRQDAGEFVEWYSDVLAWSVVGAELTWLLAPYAPLWALGVGVMIAFGFIHQVVGWNLPIVWSRHFGLWLQVALLVLIVSACVRNYYEIEYLFASADKASIQSARGVETAQELKRRNAELSGIVARIQVNQPGSAEYDSARTNLRRWEDEAYPKPIRYVRQGWRRLTE